MFNRKKTQEKLDAAYLRAVKYLNFSKAYKLMKQGASFSAKDDEGNTAFHQLALADFLFSEGNLIAVPELNQFVSFLLNKGLDLHVPNKNGETLLTLLPSNSSYSFYLSSSNPFYIENAESQLFSLFYGHVKDLDEYGERGMMPLHAAAKKGKEVFLSNQLAEYPGLIKIQNQSGKYLHETAAECGHNALSRSLLGKLEAYQAREKVKLQKEEKSEKKIKVEKIPSLQDFLDKEEEKEKKENPWLLLDKGTAAHVVSEDRLGYKITQIFNFQVRAYTKIIQNLETKHDTVIEKEFDQFIDKGALYMAHEELLRMGGEVDKQVISSFRIKKTLGKSTKLGSLKS